MSLTWGRTDDKPLTPGPVSDINTLGDRILRFLGISYTDIFGINVDGTENKNDLYLRRYYVYRGKHRPHIYLHHIVRSDYERHDHPWDFTSIILTGEYREHLATVSHWGDDHGIPEVFMTSRVKKAGDIVSHKAEELHRLELTKPMWTLVFSGKKTRLWGFQTTDKGWIPFNTLYQYIKDMMP
jgi:hypothetical protein